MTRWVERLKEWCKKIGTATIVCPIGPETEKLLQKQHDQEKLHLGDNGSRLEPNDGGHGEKD